MVRECTAIALGLPPRHSTARGVRRPCPGFWRAYIKGQVNTINPPRLIPTFWRRYPPGRRHTPARGMPFAVFSSTFAPASARKSASLFAARRLPLQAPTGRRVHKAKRGGDQGELLSPFASPFISLLSPLPLPTSSVSLETLPASRTLLPARRIIHPAPSSHLPETYPSSERGEFPRPLSIRPPATRPDPVHSRQPSSTALP